MPHANHSVLTRLLLSFAGKPKCNHRTESNKAAASKASPKDTSKQVLAAVTTTTTPTPNIPTTQPAAVPAEREVSPDITVADDGHAHVAILPAEPAHVALPVTADNTKTNIATPTSTTNTCQPITQATSTPITTQAPKRLVAVATTVDPSGRVRLAFSVLPQPLVRLAITPLEEQCAVATTITTTPEATTMPATPAAHTCKQEAAALAAPAPLLLAPSPSEACMADFLVALLDLSPSTTTTATSSCSSCASAAAPDITEAVITLPSAQPSKKSGEAGRRSLAASISATFRKWDAELTAANRRLQEKLEAAASKRAVKRAARREMKMAKKAAKAAALVASKQQASGASSGRLLVANMLRRLTGEARAVAQMA